MAGMHRDKCGAAFVAGFFKTLEILKPQGIKVFGDLCMCRNSIGEGKQKSIYLWYCNHFGTWLIVF